MTTLSAYQGRRKACLPLSTEGTLTEEHTTVPGSGVVEHVYYNADGTVTQSVENVALAQALARTSDGGYQVQGPPAQTTQRDMGYIHYRNSWTNTIYSVFVQTYDEYYPDSEFLFRKGLAKALAEWTSDILSMWAFATSGHKIVLASFLQLMFLMKGSTEYILLL